MRLTHTHRTILKAIDRANRNGFARVSTDELANDVPFGDLTDVRNSVSDLESWDLISAVSVAEESFPALVISLTSEGRRALRESRELDRLGVLRRMYDSTGGDRYVGIVRSDLASALMLSESDYMQAEDYLQSERLIEGTMGGMAGTISITHKGVKEVEKASSSEATEHFGPRVVQIFNAPVSHSQIQAGTRESIQSMSTPISAAAHSGVRDLVSLVVSLLDELTIPQSAMNELTAEITTLKSQIESPKPKPRILRISVETIGNILTSAAGGAAWTAAQPKVLELIDQVTRALS